VINRAINAIAVSLALVSAPVISWASENRGLDHLEKSVERRVLSNGITVLAMDRGFSPTLTLLISFRTGSVDETYRTIGAAHMLEHMLFKGTDRIGTTDYKKEKALLEKIERVGETLDALMIANPADKRIPGLRRQLENFEKEAAKYVQSSPYDMIYTSRGGVNFNAGTSRDKTTYIIELPSAELELWARLESERLRSPVLREYYRERKTVVEERLMRYDSRGVESLAEKFIATAFIAHPYRHPIIGWGSNVKYLSIRDVRDFFRTFYVPSRMTITVVGKQDTERTFRMVEKYFGKIKSGTAPPQVVIREPVHRGERRLELNFDSNPYLMIGWNKPTYPAPEDYVCDVIAGVLADGKSSRLYRSLVIEKKLAASVDAWSGFPGARYDNLFVIAAAPRHPHTAGELERAVYEELDRLSSGITKDELEIFLNKTEASMVFDLSSNRGVARAIDYYQTIFGDWRYLPRYMNEVKNVTVDDVREVLKKYFTPENRTVGILINSGAKK